MEDISHYKDIVEYQSELISRWTPEGKITYVNRAYCEYFGKSKEELIGQDIKDFIPVEDRKIFLEYLGTFNKENL